MVRAHVLCCLLLAGCTGFPDLDPAADGARSMGAAPRLLPLEPLLAGADQTGMTEDDPATLTRRAEALRVRAARLRAATAVDGATRARMADGVVLTSG